MILCRLSHFIVFHLTVFYCYRLFSSAVELTLLDINVKIFVLCQPPHDSAVELLSDSPDVAAVVDHLTEKEQATVSRSRPRTNNIEEYYSC